MPLHKGPNPASLYSNVTPEVLNGLNTCRQRRNWRVSRDAWGPGKNDHKMFASTLGKLARASVIEGQKICNGWPAKAGIGEIVKFGLLFSVKFHFTLL